VSGAEVERPKDVVRALPCIAFALDHGEGAQRPHCLIGTNRTVTMASTTARMPTIRFMAKCAFSHFISSASTDDSRSGIIERCKPRCPTLRSSSRRYRLCRSDHGAGVRRVVGWIQALRLVMSVYAYAR